MKIQNFTIVCSVLLMISAYCGAQQPIFDAPWRAFDVADFPGFSPVAMAAADLNSDGKQDVVAVRQHFFQPGIAVLIGNGDGTFQSEVLYDLGVNMDVEELALVDFDSDTDLDVIATVPGLSSSDFRIAVWRNQGDGTFATEELFLIGRGPWGIAVADLNGDGFPDVATADDGYWNNTDHSVSILFHNGQTGMDAGFEDEWTQYDLGHNAREIYSADVDGDADMDLVVSLVNINGFNGQKISVLTNNGSGQFGESSSFIHGGWDFSVNDLNGDSMPDLVLAGINNSALGLTIRLNNGSGEFTETQSFELPQYSPSIRAVCTVDLDGDDDLDVVATTPSGRSGEGWLTYFNDGSGQFSEGTKYGSSKWTMDIIGCDVDSDGDSDVLTIARDSSVITVHSNPGDGQFRVLSGLDINGFLTKESVAADVTGDGIADYVYWYSQDIQILTSDGNGTFSIGDAIDLQFDSPKDVAVVDMNGDSFNDIVVAIHDAILLFPNDGLGNFDASSSLPANFCGVKEMAIGDIDNDGDNDIAIADEYNNCSGAPNITLFTNDSKGNISFAATLGSPEPMRGLRLADVNNDNNLDLVTYQAYSGFGVFLGNGDLTFAGDPVLTGEFPAYWDLGDANGDGILDLMMVMSQSSFGTVNVGVCLGYGDGGFQFPTEFPGPNGQEGGFQIVRSCHVADINDDGLFDLITTNNAPNDVSVFLADINGDLLPQDRYGTGYSPTATAIGDFDGNGLLDLATIVSLPPSGFSQQFVVLNNIINDNADCVHGDINGDSDVNLLDVQPFVQLLTNGGYACEADMNDDQSVDLLDVSGFVNLLGGQ